MNMQLDFPDAYKAGQLQKRYLMGAVMEKLRQNLPLDWWMK